MVKDLVREDGNWNYEFIQQLLPHGIVLRIVDVLSPYEDGGMDKRMWPGSKLREFTTSNAYYKIKIFADLQDEGIWKKIWRIKALDKASFLLNGDLSKHKALGNEWLAKGTCPIAKSYRAVSNVLPIVATAFRPPSGVKLKCPPATAGVYWKEINSCSICKY
ncbi:hypothetical protein D0Y65_048645 [Glycine soja]|uniref:Uncharacterized protein n=1 Tax=Glycine soja TaxID=3848 RepID=A0A445FTN6_GLYSO|nr:hypothetical protein D0Y65_048645 [Glycine soja]